MGVVREGLAQIEAGFISLGEVLRRIADSDDCDPRQAAAWLLSCLERAHEPDWPEWLERSVSGAYRSRDTRDEGIQLLRAVANREPLWRADDVPF